MAKFMYWLWGLAEDREFRGGPLMPFWGWLTRVCDRYHGYKHDAEGYIIADNWGTVESSDGSRSAKGPY